MSVLHILSVYSSQDLIQISILKLTLHLPKHNVNEYSTLLNFNSFFVQLTRYSETLKVVIIFKKMMASSKRREVLLCPHSEFLFAWVKQRFTETEKTGSQKVVNI